jgi:hypothetical protein
MKNIAIIGAGLSGLIAARQLANVANVKIFEKSKGVGGRIATRRSGPYSFDHGAQFFTPKTPLFKEFLEPIILQGHVKHWDGNFAEIINRKIILKRKWDESPPHYVGAPSMNSFAKQLSIGADIQKNTLITSVTRENHLWQISDANGKLLGEYDWVLVSTPPNQALQLLPQFLSLDSKLITRRMQSCFSLMLGFSGDLALPFDAAVPLGEDISWISVNSSKPDRGQAYCLLIHSTNDWADQHFENDRNVVLKHLVEETSCILDRDINSAAHKTLHGWRFANIARQEEKNYFLDANHNLAMCGDWFIKGRVEAAFTSGYKAARAIEAILSD